MTKPTKRLATQAERVELKVYLLAHGCPSDQADQIIKDRPYIKEDRYGKQFCS